MRKTVMIGSLLLSCEGEVLSVREEYTYESTNCIGGINEQAEKASRDQCADARNVWNRNGRVEQRPGYVGITTYTNTSGAADTSLNGAVLISETPAGTFTAAATSGSNLSLNSLPVGSRWYIGTTTNPDDILNIAVGVQLQNSNKSAVVTQYYDGVAWRWLYMTELPADASLHGNHIGGAANDWITFAFATPADWSQTTITVSGTDYTRYFIRFTVQESDLDAAVGVRNGTNGMLVGTYNASGIRGMHAPRFPSTKRYISIRKPSGSLTFRYVNSASIDRNSHDRTGYSATGLSDADEPATSAAVPEFDEAYLAYNHLVTVHKAYPASTDDIHAKVEARHELVGPNAQYSTSYIAQLGDFPRAKYITFFRGFLWAAGIDGDPHGVRWSAPSPAYKVWPLLSRETLAENDNSRVTAIYGFGESLLVWKNDSLWQMVFTGTNAFSLAEFSPVRVPGAVGCVSQSSVVEIHGWVYWLAEDGVYRFNGATVEPVFKDRIQSVFRRINTSRRAFSAATDWPAYNVYLLAVALDGSDANNTVLAFDYENGAWWIWDGIEAQFWLLDEDAADNSVLYFGDSSGRIYEMGKGLTDHGGAITSYVTSHRFGRRFRGHTKTARVATVESNNLARSLSIECLPDDAVDGADQTRSYTDPFEVEYGAAVASSKYVTDRRRTRRAMFRDDCRHFQVKVTHSTKNTPFALHSIEAGYQLRGRRR